MVYSDALDYFSAGNVRENRLERQYKYRRAVENDHQCTLGRLADNRNATMSRHHTTADISDAWVAAAATASTTISTAAGPTASTSGTSSAGKRSSTPVLSLKRLKREHVGDSVKNTLSNDVEPNTITTTTSHQHRRKSSTKASGANNNNTNGSSIFDIDDSAFEDLIGPVASGLSRQEYAKIKADKLKRAILKNIEELKCAQREGYLSDDSLDAFNRNREELESCNDQISLCESRRAQCDIKIAEYQEKIRDLRTNRTQYLDELSQLKKLKNQLQTSRDGIVEDHPELYGQTQTFSLVENILNTVESSDLWFVSGERCSVCYNANVRPVKIRKCSHYLCSKCIEQIIVGSKTCPICRGTIDETEEFDISSLTTIVKTHNEDAPSNDSPDFFDNTAEDYAAAIAAQQQEIREATGADGDEPLVASEQMQLLGVDIPTDVDPRSFEYLNVDPSTVNVRALHAFAADTLPRRNHILHGRGDQEMGLIADDDSSTSGRSFFSPTITSRERCNVLLFVDFYKSVHAAMRIILIDDRESFGPQILQNLHFQLRRDSRLPESRMPSTSTRRLDAFRSRYPDESLARSWLGNVYERHIVAINAAVQENITTEQSIKAQLGAVSVWLQNTCANYTSFVREFGLFRPYNPIDLHSINYYCLYRHLIRQ